MGDVSLACLGKYGPMSNLTPQKQENEGNRVSCRKGGAL